MSATRLTGMLVGVLLAITACGGGKSDNSAAGAATPGGDGGAAATAAPAGEAAKDCGVTLDDVKALAPDIVTVSVRKKSAPGEDGSQDCEYYWIYRKGGLADPGNVHISYNTSSAKSLHSGVDQGLFGQPADVPGVGDKAWLFTDSDIVQLIATKGSAGVNIQVRYFPDKDEAKRVAAAVAKKALKA